jgi:hypothetical protein
MDSGLGIRDILNKVKYFWQDVWKYKFLVILSSFLMASIFVLIAWLTPRYYPAPVTFMVDTNEGGGGMGSMMAVIGELGLGESKGGSNYEKIGVLAKSRLIVEKTLKTKVNYKSEEDYVGNILIKEYEISFADPSLNSIQFSDSITIANNSSYERVLKKMHLLVVGTKEQAGLLAYDYDDESTLISLTALAKTPRLSILLAETHYQNLSDFYIENNTWKQEQLFLQVSDKTDSIYKELRSAEYQLADHVDASKGAFMYKSRLPEQRLARKVEILYVMYGEALKNKETSQFLLNNATPYFQVIDTPIEPIHVQGKSRASGLIKGGLLGLLLGIGLVIGRQWFLDEISEGG